jgi:predicted RNase H-like nuclease (RuvC/YqgF family)
MSDYRDVPNMTGCSACAAAQHDFGSTYCVFHQPTRSSPIREERNRIKNDKVRSEVATLTPKVAALENKVAVLEKRLNGQSREIRNMETIKDQQERDSDKEIADLRRKLEDTHKLAMTRLNDNMGLADENEKLRKENILLTGSLCKVWNIINKTADEILDPTDIKFNPSKVGG